MAEEKDSPTNEHTERHEEMQQEMANDKAKSNMDEILSQIDQELLELHKLCVSQGLSQAEIELTAKPLFDIIQQHQRQVWLSRAFKLAVLLGIISVLWQWDPAYNTILFVLRIGSMKLVKYWDWTVYKDECLINNPYYQHQAVMTEENCKPCINITGIARVSNISQSVVLDEYLMKDKPFIVTDGVKDWKASQRMDIHYLYQLYSSDENMKAKPCSFAHSKRMAIEGSSSKHEVHQFLEHLAENEKGSYFAHWQNCDSMAGKRLREEMQRPYFISPVVELSIRNWILIANDYVGKKIPLDTGLAFTYVAVIKGEVTVILTPVEVCSSSCQTYKTTVKEGEIFVMMTMLYYLDYVPTAKGKTVAIAAGGTFL